MINKKTNQPTNLVSISTSSSSSSSSSLLACVLVSGSLMSTGHDDGRRWTEPVVFFVMVV